MKRPTFIKGVAVAFVLAIAGAVSFVGLKLIFSPGLLVKALIAGLAGIYVLYLLAASGAKSGRVATPALWLAGAVTAWLFVPGLALYLAAHVGMVWLIRSAYFHTSVLPALIDLLLCAIAALAAIVTARHSHSLFLTIWAFFLCQALFVAIPSLLGARSTNREDDPALRFNRALRTAEAAVRRLHATK
jgi:hypothetical protein